MAEVVHFLLSYSKTNFAAIRGAVRTPLPPFQYDFSGKASEYCLNETGILEDTPAGDGYPEFWQVRLSSHMYGDGDDVAVALIKRYSPILKAAGYQGKPYLYDRNIAPHSYKMEWDGPSNVWVIIETDTYVMDPKDAGRVLYEIDVGHDIK